MLTQKLTELLEAINELHHLLDEEKLCLKEKKFTNLNTLLFNKQKLLQKITNANKIISNDNYLTQIKQEPTLLALQVEIQSRLKTCQKNNNINGRLIEMSMKSNQHLMQLLTQAKGKNSVTYDQKGILNGGSLLGENIEA